MTAPAAVTPLAPIFTDPQLERGRLARIKIASRSHVGRVYPMVHGMAGWIHAGAVCEAANFGTACWHVKTLNEYEEEDIMNETQAPPMSIVPATSGRPESMALRLGDIKERQRLVEQFFKEVMVKDVDFGVIPGTPKPSLWKPGAEKLAEFYGYAPVIKDTRESVNEQTGFARMVVTIALVERGTGEIVAEGVGEANTMEDKHRWRESKRTCPKCGSAALRKGKDDTGGGWYCWAKIGGCGAKFGDNAPEITSQMAGRIENAAPWDLWNTILKMAKKRAVVDAVLSATRSSGLFTQDVEDLDEWISTSEGIEVSTATQTAERNGDRPRTLDRRPSGRPASPATGQRHAASTTAASHFADDPTGKIALRDICSRAQRELQPEAWANFTREMCRQYTALKVQGGAVVITGLADRDVPEALASAQRLMPGEPNTDTESGIIQRKPESAPAAPAKATARKSAPMQQSTVQRIAEAIKRLVAETDVPHQRTVLEQLKANWPQAFGGPNGQLDSGRTAVTEADRLAILAHVEASLDGAGPESS